jgi:hypothetical protein
VNADAKVVKGADRTAEGNAKMFQRMMEWWGSKSATFKSLVMVALALPGALFGINSLINASIELACRETVEWAAQCVPYGVVPDEKVKAEDLQALKSYHSSRPWRCQIRQVSS